jgi:hypothetical protein
MVTQTSPEVLDRFKKELPALALRVRDGNDKCIAAWIKIQDIDDLKVYSAGLDRIVEAVQKLRLLAIQLKNMEEEVHGKVSCYYVMSNGKKARKCVQMEKSVKGQDVETICWVCYSTHPYWREEWSEFYKLF